MINQVSKTNIKPCVWRFGCLVFGRLFMLESFIDGKTLGLQTLDGYSGTIILFCLIEYCMIIAEASLKEIPRLDWAKTNFFFAPAIVCTFGLKVEEIIQFNICISLSLNRKEDWWFAQEDRLFLFYNVKTVCELEMSILIHQSLWTVEIISLNKNPISAFLCKVHIRAIIYL